MPETTTSPIVEVTVEHDKNTPKKWRYTGKVLGIDVSVYISKEVKNIPDQILLTLEGKP